MRKFIITLFLLAIIYVNCQAIEPIWTVSSSSFTYIKVKYSNDGKSIYTICSDTMVRVYDAGSGELKKHFKINIPAFNNSNNSSADISNDAKYIIFCTNTSQNYYIYYWDIAKDTILWTEEYNVLNIFNDSFTYYFDSGFSNVLISNNNQKIYISFAFDCEYMFGFTTLGFCVIKDKDNFVTIDSLCCSKMTLLNESPDANFLGFNKYYYLVFSHGPYFYEDEHYGFAIKNNSDSTIDISTNDNFDAYNFSPDSKKIYITKGNNLSVFDINSKSYELSVNIGNIIKVWSLQPLPKNNNVITSVEYYNKNVNSSIQIINKNCGQVIDSLIYINSDSINVVLAPDSINFLGYSNNSITLYKSSYVYSSISDNNSNFISDISAYPNPFNNTTSIQYSLNNYSNVKIELYNVEGQLLQTLLNQEKSVGKYTITLDGNGLSTGVYYCRITTNEQTKAIMLVYINR